MKIEGKQNCVKCLEGFGTVKHEFVQAIPSTPTKYRSKGTMTDRLYCDWRMQARSFRQRRACAEACFWGALLALEVRRAFFDERLRAFEMIFRREHQVLPVALVVEKIRQIEIQTDSQSFLGETLGERRLRRDLLRERGGRFAELRVRHYFVHHPDSLGFGGVDDVAAQDEFVRARESHEARQYEQSAGLGNQSASNENLAEARLVRAHAHVAHQRDVASVADGGAVDGRDGRLRIGDKQIERDGAMLAPFLD